MDISCYIPPRTETRAEIAVRLLAENGGKRKVIPGSSFCIPNLNSEENIAALIRSAVAFGIETCYIIGAKPEYKTLRKISCGTNNVITIKNFKRPSDFIGFCRDNDITLISMEKNDESENIGEFPTNKVCICLGHETHGVPVEILYNSIVWHVEMCGPVNSMNVSAVGSIIFHHFHQNFKHLVS